VVVKGQDCHGFGGMWDRIDSIIPLNRHLISIKCRCYRGQGANSDYINTNEVIWWTYWWAYC
jgi:hypothetical protein